jgi:hypothetical protein
VLDPKLQAGKNSQMATSF